MWGTPRFVATLLCGIRGTSAMLPSGHVADVLYLQHSAAAEIMGGTPRFVSTLLRGILGTPAMLPSGHVAGGWYLQHSAAAEIMGGTQCFVAILVCIKMTYIIYFERNLKFSIVFMQIIDF